MMYYKLCYGVICGEYFMSDYTIERFELTTNLKEFYEKYVDYEYTRLKCSVCSSFDKKWSCPDFDFDVDDIWKKYDNIKLFLLKFTFTEEFMKNDLSFVDFRDNSRNLFQAEKRNILQEMLDEEERLNGLYLTCGPCNLCAACSRLDNKPCRNLSMRRYAMESVGTNVVIAVEELFGITPQWIREDSRPDYHIFLNAILF